jgi:hypothetical protein
MYTEAGSEVLAAMVMKSSVFWDKTPCSPLKLNRRFGGISPARNQRENRWEAEPTAFKLVSWFFHPEDGTLQCIRNIGYESVRRTHTVALTRRIRYLPRVQMELRQIRYLTSTDSSSGSMVLHLTWRHSRDLQTAFQNAQWQLKYEYIMWAYFLHSSLVFCFYFYYTRLLIDKYVSVLLQTRQCFSSDA